MSKATVAIYGGNGFAGSAIARQLQGEGYIVTCVSRTGAMPLQLKESGAAWAHDVEWLKGDVATPDESLLKSSDIVITTVGSPPVPTFNQDAFDAQFHANGQANMQLLDACVAAGVKRILVIGANIPWPMQTPKFAYFKGKQAVVEHALKLFNGTDTSVAVLQPSVIYGDRYTKSGKRIPLGIMKYPSKLLQKLSFSAAPVSADQIAKTCSVLLSAEPTSKNMVKIVSNDEILSLGG